MNIKELLPQEPNWIKENVILFGKVGSHAYGTATEKSDLDYKGILIPPVEYFLGLQQFEGYDKTGGKNFKNNVGDVDVTLLHINKFVKDAIAGVPNNLELLFLGEGDYLYLNELGKEIVDMRSQFLSKQIMKKFGGYAKSQAQKMKQLNSNGRARSELVEQFGYDTKFYMHTVRLLEMAIEILNEHTLNVKRPNAIELVKLREGTHTLKDALLNIEKLETALQTAYEESTLRNEPDIDYINKWLVEFNKRAIL